MKLESEPCGYAGKKVPGRGTAGKKALGQGVLGVLLEPQKPRQLERSGQSGEKRVR